MPGQQQCARPSGRQRFDKSGTTHDSHPHARLLPWRLLCLLAGLLLMLCPAWVRAAQTVTLQLGWTPQFQFAGYYVALERGYYRDAGLDVLIRPAAPGTPAPIEAVTSGRAEFGTANSGLASARMNGQPVTAVAAVLQHSASVWLVRSQTDQPPDVHDLHDLAQRRLSAITGPGESVELLAPFLVQGIGANQLHLVPTNYGLEPLLDGTVDAISASLANEPFELERRGVGFAVVEPSHFGIDFYGEVLFTSDAFAHDHPDAVKRMRAASLRGWAAAFADIEGTARMIHQRYAPGRSVEQLRHEGEVLRQLAEPNKADLGQMSISRWRDIAATQRRLGLGADPTRMDGFVFQPEMRPTSRLGDPLLVALASLALAACFSAYRLARTRKSLLAELTQLRSQPAAQETRELRFGFLLEAAPFPVVIFRVHDGQITYRNEHAMRWLGLKDELLTAGIQSHLPALTPDGPLMQQLRNQLSMSDIELELPDPAGRRTRWCLLTMRLIDHQGAVSAFASINDITARKSAELELALLNAQRGRIVDEIAQLQARLREQSVRDALTGLFNRRYFEETTQRELHRCAREQLPLSMLVLDADHFKRINDRHGHAGGDAVLRAVATVLREFFRAQDIVSRYGGEEFVVVMPGIGCPVAQERAEQLRCRIAELPIDYEGQLIQVTMSIGVAWTADSTEPAAQLFKRADAAAYEAKRRGRNCVATIDTITPANDLPIKASS